MLRYVIALYNITTANPSVSKIYFNFNIYINAYSTTPKPEGVNGTAVNKEEDKPAKMEKMIDELIPKERKIK